MKVVDMKGREIIKGCEVLVHQDEEITKAIVIQIFPDSPTVNENGYWVDIDKGDGIEGMMSYILEVTKN
jgi:hypothetical protein